MSLWVYVRLAVILAAAVGACFGPLQPRAAPAIGWGALAVIFFALVFGLVPVLGIQRINPMSAETWHPPSWDLNPFNFSQPLQFFHLGAYACLAGGVVTLLRLVTSGVPFYMEALLPLVMGAGVLLGIRLVMVVFRSKMAATPNNRWRGP